MASNRDISSYGHFLALSNEGYNQCQKSQSAGSLSVSNCLKLLNVLFQGNYTHGVTIDMVNVARYHLMTKIEVTKQ